MPKKISPDLITTKPSPDLTKIVTEIPDSPETIETQSPQQEPPQPQILPAQPQTLPSQPGTRTTQQ
jgi:hypothetical protein